MKPKVCVLRTDGTNCDRETAHAFNLVGGDAEVVHINSLKRKHDPVQRKDISLDDYNVLAIPGGFSYGDYISAGKILAQDLRQFLGEEIKDFVDSGKLVIGICNGFQVLVKSGLLPNLLRMALNNLSCNLVFLLLSNEAIIPYAGTKYLLLRILSLIFFSLHGFQFLMFISAGYISLRKVYPSARPINSTCS